MKVVPLQVSRFAIMVMVMNTAAWAMPLDDDEYWSKTVNGLQARLVLVERPKINGTRQLHPYLELRNVSDLAYPLKVRCDTGHVKFELVGTDGKVIRSGWSLPRSGLHLDPGTVVLPFDSSIRIGMRCSNWGIPKDAPAMIATDSGAWVLQKEEKGKVFLRVTVKGEKVESDPDRIWEGKIQALSKIDWKE
jgi:hypothetical protein